MCATAGIKFQGWGGGGGGWGAKYTAYIHILYCIIFVQQHMYVHTYVHLIHTQSIQDTYIHIHRG